MISYKTLEDLKKKAIIMALEQGATEDSLRKETSIIFKSLIYETYKDCDPLVISNSTNTIIFDVETTGFDKKKDEILQLSILDGEGNVLFDEKIRPFYKESWDKAQAVHNISPSDVAFCQTLDYFAPVIKGIFESANNWIGYNLGFDLGFLEYAGIKVRPDANIIDVMDLFANYYNSVTKNTKPRYNLGFAASYFDYEFDAHNSLEDVKATLYVYNNVK